jgi:hypothetical protein
MQTKTAKEIAVKHRSNKVVINASRRTDLPAFHVDELITGLKQGVFHPQGLMQAVWEFRFDPMDIHSVGLWSQDFSKWIERTEEVKNLPYKFWYRFSILPDDPVCKPKAPPVKDQLRQLEALVKLSGKESVFLFIDPLIKYRKLGEDWQYNFSAESVETILKQASALGIEYVTTSILDYYPKIKRRAQKQDVEFYFFSPDNPADQDEMTKMVKLVKTVADNLKMKVKTCCEKLMHNSGLAIQGACVDGRMLNAIFGPGASLWQDNAQRGKYGCGCTAAVDIGRYTEKGEWSHHCGHQCIQCYARP